MTEQRAASLVAELHRAGLLDKIDGGFETHNWKRRQYISDNSTARVQRYREKRAAAGLPITWTAPKKLKAAVHDRDGHRCVYCGTESDLSVDHKVPQSRGGTDDIDNLQTLCRPCNASKRDMTHNEFVSRNANETFRQRYRAEQSKTEQNTADAPRADQVDLVEEALRADLLEALGPDIDLSRCADWIAKGYAPAMVGEVVRDLRRRKPDIASLAYFDSALAERHAKRALTPTERATAPIDWDGVISMFARGGHWSRYAGPEPGMGGCRAPLDLLAKHGIDAATGHKIRKVG
jgi:5-methylcytosine-specific restriction endonuclease McrA